MHKNICTKNVKLNFYLFILHFVKAALCDVTKSKSKILMLCQVLTTCSWGSHFTLGVSVPLTGQREISTSLIIYRYMK